jgi:hypothetical protein
MLQSLHQTSKMNQIRVKHSPQLLSAYMLQHLNTKSAPSPRELPWPQHFKVCHSQILQQWNDLYGAELWSKSNVD